MGMYPILSVEAPIVILAQIFQELNSDRSGRINSPVLWKFTRKEGRMLGVLTNLFTILGCSGLCYILFLALKLTVVILICKHPELSDDKVKYITNMIAKRRQQSNWSILIFMPLYLIPPFFFWYNCALKYDNAFWAQFYTKIGGVRFELTNPFGNRFTVCLL